jgi:hypothetical protein
MERAVFQRDHAKMINRQMTIITPGNENVFAIAPPEAEAVRHASMFTL